MSEPAPTTSEVDPTERIELLLLDLRTAREGLSSIEVERRLLHAAEARMADYEARMNASPRRRPRAAGRDAPPGVARWVTNAYQS
jgi:hypothetical protein